MSSSKAGISPRSQSRGQVEETGKRPYKAVGDKATPVAFRPNLERTRSESPRSDSPRLNSPRSNPSTPSRSSPPRATPAPATPASWKRREVVFHEDEDSRSELGSQRNVGEETRVTVTQRKDLFGRTMYAEVDQVRWGIFDHQPACLLVLRFSYESGTSWRRFQHVNTVMKFTYRPNPSMPNNNNNSQPQPKIRKFSPKSIFGVPTRGEKETHWDWTSKVAGPSGPVQMETGLSKGSKINFTKEYASKVVGTEIGSNRVVFDVTEDKKQAHGIPNELYFGVLVVYDADKGATMQCEVTTQILHHKAMPWSRDDPIILNPGNPSSGGGGGLSPDFKSWTDEDWKKAVPFPGDRVNVVQGGAR